MLTNSHCIDSSKAKLKIIANNFRFSHHIFLMPISQRQLIMKSFSTTHPLLPSAVFCQILFSTIILDLSFFANFTHITSTVHVADVCQHVLFSTIISAY